MFKRFQNRRKKPNSLKVEPPRENSPITVNQMERLAKETFAMSVMNDVTVEILKGVNAEEIKTSADVLRYIANYLSELNLEIKNS